MTALDDLPMVDSFFGIDLKTGSMIIAAIGIVHPMAYGCSFFMPMSYLLVTIWILVSLFFAASVVLFCALIKDDTLLCTIWVWYAVIFVVVMLMMMILLALVFTSRKQRNRVFVTIFGMLWYMLTIYFILVVNSHRKKLLEPNSVVSANVDDKYWEPKPELLNTHIHALTYRLVSFFRNFPPSLYRVIPREKDQVLLRIHDFR